MKVKPGHIITVKEQEPVLLKSTSVSDCLHLDEHLNSKVVDALHICWNLAHKRAYVQQQMKQCSTLTTPIILSDEDTAPIHAGPSSHMLYCKPLCVCATSASPSPASPDEDSAPSHAGLSSTALVALTSHSSTPSVIDISSDESDMAMVPPTRRVNQRPLVKLENVEIQLMAHSRKRPHPSPSLSLPHVCTTALHPMAISFAFGFALQ